MKSDEATKAADTGSQRPALPLEFQKKPDLKPAKTLRVAVSGDVSLTQLEVDIIDTPAFQRLRRVRQLGTSHLVYPSALHSRFEHSLGTLKIACEMTSSILSNPSSSREEKDIPDDQLALIRCVALLHDIAHVPFGHTLENETYVVRPPHDEDEDRIEHFVGEDSVIGRLLLNGIGRDSHQLLRRILLTPHKRVHELGDRAYISDIVKNTVCADLLDYLRRDAYHCFLNLDYGDRFIKYLCLRRVDGARRLVVRVWKESERRHRRDILDELVQLLWVRFSLASMVYFHHAKTSSAAMIARAVWAALAQSPRGKSGLTKDKLRELGDDELLATLADKGGGVAGTLATIRFT